MAVVLMPYEPMNSLADHIPAIAQKMTARERDVLLGLMRAALGASRRYLNAESAGGDDAEIAALFYTFKAKEHALATYIDEVLWELYITGI